MVISPGDGGYAELLGLGTARICEYKKGSQNGNADALSCRSHSTDSPTLSIVNHCALTSLAIKVSQEEIRAAQTKDSLILQLLTAVSSKYPSATLLSQPAAFRYGQLWSQLVVREGILCRTFRPIQADDPATVPILPASLQQNAIHQLMIHQAQDTKVQGKPYTDYARQHTG